LEDQLRTASEGRRGICSHWNANGWWLSAVSIYRIVKKRNDTLMEENHWKFRGQKLVFPKSQLK